MDSCFNIIQWNCRSIRNKMIWMNNAPFSKVDCLVFQETFLKDDLPCFFPGKIVYRADRFSRQGGGLLIAVNTTFSSFLISGLECAADNEIMGVRIKIGSSFLNVINFYSKSGSALRELECISQSLEGPTLILGDFNLHHPVWGAHSSSRFSNDFVDWITESRFCLINTSDPTHVASGGSLSLIDLSLCSSVLLPRVSYHVLDELFDSDHFPIQISLVGRMAMYGNQKYFNWNKISQDVNTRLHQSQCISYEGFSEIVHNSMKSYCSNKPRHQKSYPPWWTARCNNLFQQKKFLLRKATRLMSVDLWIKYKRIAAKLRQVLKDSKRNYWDTVCRRARDPTILFRTLGRLQKRLLPCTDSHNVLIEDDSITVDPVEQANTFGKAFSFGTPHEPIPLDYGGENDSDLNVLFAFSELKKAIKSMRTTTPGEDMISAKFFKGLEDHSLMLLLQIYNSFWILGDVPTDWKTSIILPIHKPGKPKNLASSYRPIALTSVMGKICERMIADRIMLHLLSKDLIHKDHFGFLPFRDSHSALTVLHSDIQQAKKAKEYVLGISLDIQAAYDSVYIDGLILKCATLGIRGRILKWIHSFLTDRKLKVLWRKCYSTTFPLYKGVPQGAVLSPVLYTIFMHDFFETLTNDVRCIVYADDIFIYTSNASLETCKTKLQHSLQSIALWCNYWKLQIRPDKCHAINLSRRKGECEGQFCISNGLIQWETSITFLGFQFSRYGGLNRHVEQLRCRAFKKINLLKALSNKSFGARSRHLMNLASASIRGSIEYGAALLWFAGKTMFNRLEVLQNSALRTALGLPRWVPNIVLKRHAAVPDIQERIRMLTFNFWMKHFWLEKYSPVWRSLCNNEEGQMKDMVYTPFIYEVLDEVDCRLEHIINFNPPVVQEGRGAQFTLTDLPFQDKSLDGQIVIQYFRNFITVYENSFNIIATDAAKSPEWTGIAGCSSSGHFKYRINNVASVFTAEALAIGIAIDELVWCESPTIILSDSLSVLTSLQNVSLKSPSIIIWLHNKIMAILNRVPFLQFCWVPGHRGIPLNERADELAKSVGSRDVMIDWICFEDLIRYNKKRLWIANDSVYCSSKYRRCNGNIPTIHKIHLWSTNRREDVLITRLICRMLITPALLYRFRLVGSDKCERCQVPDSLDHILFHCTKYRLYRIQNWERAGYNIVAYSNSFSDFMELFCADNGFRIATLNFIFQTNRF